MDDHIYPNEAEYHEQTEELGHDGDPPILDKLKAAARERGLWNLFLRTSRPTRPGTKLSNLDYAPISEQLGKVGVRLRGAELRRARHRQHGDPQRLRLGDRQAGLAGAVARGRDPLGVLDDRTRRRRRPTPPTSACASSRDGDEYVLNGTKWFSLGCAAAAAARCSS